MNAIVQTPPSPAVAVNFLNHSLSDIVPQASVKTGVTVLMSTYAAETAGNLREAFESIYRQTQTPDRVVLVIDGPVDDGQHAVMADYAVDPRGPALTILALPENGGLAKALNAGLAVCDSDFVMRMDSDDVCMPDRLEIQLAYLKANPEIALVSSWSSEFTNDGTVDRMKVSPTEHDALAQALRWRNVIAHSAIMVRTSALRDVNGYRSDFGKLEDYDLYVRMITAGAQFHVIPKVLLKVRISLEQSNRRGNMAYFLKEIQFRLACVRNGFLTRYQFTLLTCLYFVFRVVSPSIRQRMYALSRI